MPTKQSSKLSPTAIEEQPAKLTQQVASLAARATQTTDRKKYKQVSVRDMYPTARLDNPPPKSDAQMKAHRWLDIVVNVVKDHNYKADGDKWKMWAL